MQRLIVYVLIFLSAVYLGIRAFKKLKNRQSGGCSGCGCKGKDKQE